METQSEQRETITKAGAPSGMVLSPSDATEFRAYKRQKKIREIRAAIASSATPIGSDGDVQSVCERAVRLRQAAVVAEPIRLPQILPYLTRNGISVDCIVGGNGETLGKVKAYEARLARRMRVGEISVVVAPSLLSACRYTEIKRELKRVTRAAKRVACKVYVGDCRNYAAVARVARIASEVGARYFCVPYFSGCERLRLDLTGGCKLEVRAVEDLATFRKMTEAGVERIVSSHIGEIYAAWSEEAEKELSQTYADKAEKRAEERVAAQSAKTTDTEQEKPSALLPTAALPVAREELKARAEERLS